MQAEWDKADVLSKFEQKRDLQGGLDVDGEQYQNINKLHNLRLGSQLE